MKPNSSPVRTANETPSSAARCLPNPWRDVDDRVRDRAQRAWIAKSHVDRHADLQQAAVVGHADLHRIDQVRSLVAGLDRRRRELGL